MTNPAEAVRSQAVLIPARVRGWIYAGLGTLAAAEGVILLARPELAPWITAVFGFFQALGFVVAKSNVPRA
jgi:hypothetical protein